MLVNVTRIAWPGAIVFDEKSEHWMTSPLGFPQLPTLAFAVTSWTVPFV